MIILSLTRLCLVLSGYVLSLTYGVLGATTDNNLAQKGIHDFVLYASGLGYNLTELLQTPILTKDTAKIPCAQNKGMDICSNIFRTNQHGDSEIQYILSNVSRTCHLNKETFGCLRHFVSTNSSLRKWTDSVQKALNSFCSQACWKNVYYMTNFTCSLTPDSSTGQNKSVTKLQVSFSTEVLNTICNNAQYHKRTCSADVINRYLSQTSSQAKYCFIKESECSKECQEESQLVNETIGCCMFLTADVLEKNNITDTPLQRMIKACQSQLHSLQDGKICQSSQVPTSSSTKPVNNQSNRKSISGRLIAGILISLIISSIGIFLMARCIYRMIRRKKSARYEDYGYSQLRMMEESLYDDVEETDDELLEI